MNQQREVVPARELQKLIDRWRKETGKFSYKASYKDYNDAFNQGVKATLLDCADSLRDVLAGFPVL